MTLSKLGLSTLLILMLLLSGCKSSEERLFEVCGNKLKTELKTWAKYDGWSLDKAKFTLSEMAPDDKRNTEYDTNQFWSFKVIISEFTVKNAFNADVNSISLCNGIISKDSKGDYEPSMDLITDVTLNGERLGF